MGSFSTPASIVEVKNRFRVEKLMILDGTAGKGAIGTVPLFVVGQYVVVRDIFATVQLNFTSAGAATIALGVTGATAAFNAATLVSTADSVTAAIWAGGAFVGKVAQPAAMKDYLISPGTASILATIGIADCTAGQINFSIIYDTMSAFNGDSAGILAAA